MLMSLVSFFLISSSVNFAFTLRLSTLHAVSEKLLVNSYGLTYRLIQLTAVGRDEEDFEVLLHKHHPVFALMRTVIVNY